MLTRTPSGLVVYTDPVPAPEPEPPAPPPRITACLDCGGATEPGWEHETRYDRICRPCRKVFSFSALNVYGSVANVYRSCRPLIASPACDPSLLTNPEPVPAGNGENP